MRQLEMIGPDNWEEFLGDGTAVLMLGKTDCAACSEWTTELSEFLAGDEEFTEVRFGKLVLDQRGLIDFKKANPWLAEVDVLPFNAIYRDGEKVKDFAGKGLPRLQNRLRNLAG